MQNANNHILTGSLLAAFIFSPALILDALALPFKKDCASMARFAQAVAAKNSEPLTRYTFLGFKGPLRQEPGWAELYCEGGYVSVSSPKGTEVCDAYITYIEKDGVLRFDVGSYTDSLADIKRLQFRNEMREKHGRRGAELADTIDPLPIRPPSCRWK